MLLNPLFSQVRSLRLVATGQARTPIALTLCGSLLLIALSACSQRLEPGECDRLLDVYSEKLLLSVNPQLSGPELLKLQQRTRELAHERPEYDFPGCMKRVRRTQYECALQAPTLDAIERCLTL